MRAFSLWEAPGGSLTRRSARGVMYFHGISRLRAYLECGLARCDNFHKGAAAHVAASGGSLTRRSRCGVMFQIWHSALRNTLLENGDSTVFIRRVLRVFAVPYISPHLRAPTPLRKAFPLVPSCLCVFVVCFPPSRTSRLRGFVFPSPSLRLAFPFVSSCHCGLFFPFALCASLGLSFPSAPLR